MRNIPTIIQTMSEIDPIQYDAIIDQGGALERTVESLTTKVDQLLELANR